MTSQIPSIQLGGSAPGEDDPSAPIGSIAEDYAQLIAAGSNAFQASGSRVFNMDAGAISMASPAQIGRVYQGVTITAAVVAENQKLLDAIGAYCRQNGITITVGAALDLSSADDWTYQWLDPAVEAQLPITAVENVDEVAVSDPPVSFPTVASDAVAVVKQIVEYYPSVAIGQWEGGNSIGISESWWAAYDSAAAAADLPKISYVVADTSWDAPWETSDASWQSWLSSLSGASHADGMELHVLLGGIETDATDQEWVTQSEQHAAMLASLTGIQVDALLIRTWQNAYPTSVGPTNSPGTLSNDALEIAATYPLYASSLISASGPIGLSTPPQVIVQTGEVTSLGALSLSWDASDLGSQTRAALVITDATGELVAKAAGSGSVTGSGTTTLVLDGTASDLASELSTLTLQEPVAGPDTIDVEVFGANGLLAEAQSEVVSFSGYIGDSSQTTYFSPASSGQEWQSANVTTEKNGNVLSETLTWAANENTASGYAQIQTVSVYEPLATISPEVVGGRVVNSSANPASGSAASLPIGLPSFNSNAYNPAGDLTSLIVLSTTNSFSPTSGNLLTQTLTLASAAPTPAMTQYGISNSMATGGTQVIQENTGDNPNWSSNWSPSLSSVTTTYDSAGTIIEQVFQGGPSEPDYSLTNVYSPSTGDLWEQFQTASPPQGYGQFATGNLYVTEFNTGDNPNWDWNDWGSATQVTVTWQDYYAISVSSTAPVQTGSKDTDAYGTTAQNSADGLQVVDMTDASAVPALAQAYNGPVSGLQEEYVTITSDNLNISASTPNWFIHTGAGMDAIAVSSGSNVLDGGQGSNFLTGGSGTDTFFVDAREATSDVWSTVSNFHVGDAATVWGVSPSSDTLVWANGEGASGFTGLTAHFTAPGGPTASLTLVGYTTADLSDGRLAVSYGFDSASGSNYAYIRGT